MERIVEALDAKYPLADEEAAPSASRGHN
jgi:hypothetical protein